MPDANISVLVTEVVRSIVDQPELVQVTEKPGASETLVELSVGPGDMGRVIGKQGRTARSLRTLVHAAAREHRRYTLEIVE